MFVLAGTQIVPTSDPIEIHSDVIRTRVLRDVVVVAPQGVLDRPTIEEVDDVLARVPHAPVVIDLSECTLNDPVALDALDPSRVGRTADQTCIACSRVSGRSLVSRSPAADRLAVFHRPEDAVQARVLARSGFGSGWRT